MRIMSKIIGQFASPALKQVLVDFRQKQLTPGLVFICRKSILGNEKMKNSIIQLLPVDSRFVCFFQPVFLEDPFPLNTVMNCDSIFRFTVSELFLRST